MKKKSTFEQHFRELMAGENQRAQKRNGLLSYRSEIRLVGSGGASYRYKRHLIGVNCSCKC